ncbi:hypothetical protein F8O01_10070 [Pseudoclavibacter chungangensis]|uniref:LPXTG cell wall anchor domain-containing protein n=1 Tax=Pseudoclavibacter chungangensis TaxID=587635 RepID=A0A7J5BQZ4_9MICO|nr:hypothetical protein [Pseudoclavibacter chungangensis]KAB1656721.1 hypothetical protein F8O01_10070 [Pseudoclavibacter chungangensis]NYJ67824.1 hypothetical protein [Pseudoclavibacter chungangensis]
MTSQHSFRPGARIGALALAFGVVSGAFALTAAPAFADTTVPTDPAASTPSSSDPAASTPSSSDDPAASTPTSSDPAASTPTTSEAPVEATISTDKANYAPTDTVLYAGTGWLPGEKVTILVEGPLSGTLEVIPAEDGTIADQIVVVEVDQDGNETGGSGVWPEGSYTVTATQEQPDEETPGGDEGTSNELVSATTTFTVGDAAAAPSTPAPSQTPRQLAETGADDVFGIAGLGLLVAGAGAAALIGRRLIAKKA